MENNSDNANQAFKQVLGRARAWKAYIRTIVAALIIRQAKLSARLAEVGGK